MSEKIPNEQVMESIKAEINYIAEEAYQKGLQEGEERKRRRRDHDEQLIEQGRNEAWAAARRVCQTDCIAAIEEIGLDTSNTVTWTDALDVVMKTYTAAEVIEKLKAYEETKKAEAEIKVGDEVEAFSGRAIVFEKFTEDGEERCYYWYPDEKRFDRDRVIALRKTGRHFPEVVELLKKVKGGEE